MQDDQEANGSERRDTRTPRTLLPPSLLRGTAAEGPLASDNGEAALGDQLLRGAAAIKEWIGLEDEKQVYNLRERTDIPIFQMPGFGLVARKAALEAWVLQQEEEDLAHRRRRKNRKT